MLTSRPAADRFRSLTAGAGLAAPVALLLIVAVLLQQAGPAIMRFGFGFITGRVWNPVTLHFAALPYIYGTLLTSVIALLIALPIGVGVALFLADKLHGGFGLGGACDALSLLAAALYAAYSVVLKPLPGRYPATVVTAWTLRLRALPGLALPLPSALAQDWGRVDAVGWAVLAWSIAAPVYAAWTLWSWATARAGVAATSAFLFLVPVIAGATSWVLLHEAFGPLKVLGGLLALGGLALARHVGEVKQPDRTAGRFALSAAPRGEVAEPRPSFAQRRSASCAPASPPGSGGTRKRHRR